MTLLNKGIALAATKMPKVISPKTHAMLDYAVIGSCLVGGALMWRRNKRAGLAALVCAGATALNVMLTDYPGGRYPVIPYKLHGKIDAGVAALTAAMPRIMDFNGESETQFFEAQALAETAITGLTDFEYYDDDEDSPELRSAI